MRPLEDIKKEIQYRLDSGHPGNLQVSISDKCLLHCADVNTGYDDEDNEITDSIDFSFNFYGEHIDCTVKLDKENECVDIVYAEGNLLSSFEDFLEDDDTWPVISFIWDAIEKWTYKYNL